jgi:hypothetical protein
VTSVVSPAGTTGGPSIAATIGAGFTEVTFTNSRFIVSTGYTNVSTGSINWSSTPFLVANPLPLTVTSTSAVAFTATATVISGPAGWLTVSPGQGTTPATLTLSAAPLPIGAYAGTITITSADGATGLSVPVTYTVALQVGVASTVRLHGGACLSMISGGEKHPGTVTFCTPMMVIVGGGATILNVAPADVPPVVSTVTLAVPIAEGQRTSPERASACRIEKTTRRILATDRNRGNT